MAPVHFLRVRPKFVLFGDSLTERSFGPGGWGASLAHEFRRRVDVVNRGMSGYNSAWALHTVHDVFGDLTTNDTALVTVCLGANDAVIKGVAPNSSRQHVPLDQYKANLEKIVGSVRARGISHILLISPPPLDDKGYKETGSCGANAADRTNANTGQYAAASKALAGELGLPHVDLWAELQKHENWGRFFDDGLHYTPEGNQAVYQAVRSVLHDSFPHLNPDAMPMHFPVWDDVNADDPSATFGPGVTV